MNWNRNAQTWCLALALCLFQTFPATSRAEEGLFLPDRIVLKEDAELPVGVTSREFRGYVVEETGDLYRVEISARRGISSIVALPKQVVLTLERGDGSDWEYQILKPRLEMPQVSQEVHIYRDTLLKPIDAYLGRFQESKHAAELRSFRAKVEAEIEQVEKGWFRTGAFWFRPDELPASALPEWKRFLALRDEGMEMPSNELETITNELQGSGAKFLHPQSVLLMRNILNRRLDLARQYLAAAQIDKDKAKIKALEKQLEEEGEFLEELAALDVEQKSRGLDHLQKARQAILLDPPDFEAFRREYQASKEFWKDLEDRAPIIYAVLEEEAKKLEASLSGNDLEMVSRRAGGLIQIVDLVRGKNDKIKKDLEMLGKKANARLYELQIQRLVESGELREALAIFGKLKATGVRSAGELARVEKDLIALEYEKTKIEIARLKEAGDDPAVLLALERAHDFVKARQADSQASNYLGNEAAMLAKESALNMKPYVAVQAAFLANKIAPDLTPVRTVYWVTLAILGMIVVGIVLVLLLFYTSFDNILHQWRYRLRLRALRDDEKSRGLKRRKGLKRSK